MNISRTAQVRKPVAERWHVEDKSGRYTETTFDSTADMLASDIDLNGRNAVFDYTSKKASEYTMKDRFDRGKVYGAVGGVGATFALGSLGGFEALHQLASNGLSEHLASAGKFGLGVAACAAVVGAIGMLLPSQDINGTNFFQTKGVLLTEGNETVLRLRSGEKDVNLTEYQHATVPELENGQRHYGTQWWNRSGRETV